MNIQKQFLEWVKWCLAVSAVSPDFPYILIDKHVNDAKWSLKQDCDETDSLKMGCFTSKDPLLECLILAIPVGVKCLNLIIPQISLLTSDSIFEELEWTC